MATKGLLLGTVFNPPPVGGPTLLGVTQSVDFNGTDEKQEDATNAAVGIGNEWSLSIWVKPTRAATNEVIFHIVSGLNINRLQFSKESGEDLVFSVGTQKVWRLEEEGYIDSWSHHVFTYDGTQAASEQLKWYINGVDRSDDATRTFDGDLTMTDENRSITLGTRHVPAGQWFEGLVHSVGIWDTRLAVDAIEDLYNCGFADVDVRVDFDNYSSSANLQHFYVPGLDNTDGSTMGTDYGNGTLRDLNPTNITPADLVSDVPAKFTPLSVSNIALWLDAADTSSITVNGSNEVTQWNDKSSAALTGNFTPFDSNRPLSNTDTVNGNNAITFQDDATDRALVSASAGDIKGGSSGYTYYVVFEADDVDAEEIILFKGGDTPSEALGNEFAAYTGTGGISHQVATGDQTPSFGFTVGGQLSSNDTVGFLSVVADVPGSGSGSASEVNAYVNGEFDSARFDWDSINDPMTVSARPYYVGARNNTAQSAISDVFKGRICEIIVYTKPVPATERVLLDAYLKVKWGVA